MAYFDIMKVHKAASGREVDAIFDSDYIRYGRRVPMLLDGGYGPVRRTLSLHNELTIAGNVQVTIGERSPDTSGINLLVVDQNGAIQPNIVNSWMRETQPTQAALLLANQTMALTADWYENQDALVFSMIQTYITSLVRAGDWCNGIGVACVDPLIYDDGHVRVNLRNMLAPNRGWAPVQNVPVLAHGVGNIQSVAQGWTWGNALDCTGLTAAEVEYVFAHAVTPKTAAPLDYRCYSTIPQLSAGIAVRHDHGGLAGGAGIPANTVTQADYNNPDFCRGVLMHYIVRNRLFHSAVRAWQLVAETALQPLPNCLEQINWVEVQRSVRLPAFAAIRGRHSDLVGGAPLGIDAELSSSAVVAFDARHRPFVHMAALTMALFSGFWRMWHDASEENKNAVDDIVQAMQSLATNTACPTMIAAAYGIDMGVLYDVNTIGTSWQCQCFTVEGRRPYVVQWVAGPVIRYRIVNSLGAVPMAFGGVVGAAGTPLWTPQEPWAPPVESIQIGNATPSNMGVAYMPRNVAHVYYRAGKHRVRARDIWTYLTFMRLAGYDVTVETPAGMQIVNWAPNSTSLVPHEVLEVEYLPELEYTIQTVVQRTAFYCHTASEVAWTEVTVSYTFETGDLGMWIDGSAPIVGAPVVYAPSAPAGVSSYAAAAAMQATGATGIVQATTASAVGTVRLTPLFMGYGGFAGVGRNFTYVVSQKRNLVPTGIT